MRGACTIGVDVGGTKLLAGAVDEGLTVHHRAERRAPLDALDSLVDAIVDLVAEVREAAPAPVAAVGLGVACTLDRRRRVAVHSVHLPLVDIALEDLLAQRLAVPVCVDNDATAAMLAEWREGAARGADDALMLTVGTGIGGGLVVGGALARGAVGAAGELGHVVVDAHGPPCQGRCPNRGCLETLASGPAIAREGLRVAGERPASPLGRVVASGRELTGALVTELAHGGDADAIATVRGAGRWLGIGLSGLVNALNPEVVVVGGGVLGAGELLLAPAREEVAARALPPARDVARIVGARFGEEAGMLGAAMLAQDIAGNGLRRVA